MKRAASLLILPLLALAGCGFLSGLGNIGRAAFTREALGDLTFQAVKTGPALKLTGEAAGLTPEGLALDAILGDQAVAVLMPIGKVGEEGAWWVLCAGPMAEKCESIPIHAELRFSGAPARGTNLLIPTRIGGGE